MHPDYLLPQLTARQIGEWMAVFKQTPYGQDHTDFLLAQLTAEVANRWRGKGESPHQIKEFLPFERTKQASSEEISSTLRRVFGSGGNRKS